MVENGGYTDVHGDEETLSNPAVPEVLPVTAPNPFIERGETKAPAAQHHAIDAGQKFIINPLDEQQDLILQLKESSLRHAHTQRALQTVAAMCS